MTSCARWNLFRPDPQDQDVLVGGGLLNSGVQPDAIVNWRVAAVNDAIHRAGVENISLLITQRQENQAIIRKNNGAFQALIDTLESRLHSRLKTSMGAPHGCVKYRLKGQAD